MTGLTFVRCGPLKTAFRAMSGEVPVGLVSPGLRGGYGWELFFVGRQAGAEHGAAATVEAACDALAASWARWLDRAALIHIDGRCVRHKARGSTYRVVGPGRVQTSVPLNDMDPVTAYLGDDGELWVRSPAEFNDGRFEPVGWVS